MIDDEICSFVIPVKLVTRYGAMKAACNLLMTHLACILQYALGEQMESCSYRQKEPSSRSCSLKTVTYQRSISNLIHAQVWDLAS